MKLQLLIAILLVATACNQAPKLDINQAYLEEIKTLESDQDKSDYLHNLWQLDQSTRATKEENDIINTYGHKSAEHKKLINEYIKIDNTVLQKLRLYLETHGYPKNKSAYHELAINAFPIIIGHNHNFKVQKELLPYLYDAYKEGYCDIGDVVWVLGEMYESKNGGRRYNMTTDKFTTEQEFTELVEVLKLPMKL